jgi:hypothetical protein
MLLSNTPILVNNPVYATTPEFPGTTSYITIPYRDIPNTPDPLLILGLSALIVTLSAPGYW